MIGRKGTSPRVLPRHSHAQSGTRLGRSSPRPARSGRGRASAPTRSTRLDVKARPRRGAVTSSERHRAWHQLRQREPPPSKWRGVCVKRVWTHKSRHKKGNLSTRSAPMSALADLAQWGSTRGTMQRSLMCFTAASISATWLFLSCKHGHLRRAIEWTCFQVRAPSAEQDPSKGCTGTQALGCASRSELQTFHVDVLSIMLTSWLSCAGRAALATLRDALPPEADLCAPSWSGERFRRRRACKCFFVEVSGSAHC